LFLGTPQDNMRDRNSKNRQAKGSQQGNSKLNEEQVLEIKRLLAETTLSQRKIAKRYGVGQDAIYKIKIGKTWKHVTDQPTTNNITNNTYNAPVTNNIYHCSECQSRQLSLFDTEEFK
jgi:DNA invertase Pin-like site-specific DNA recombinase